MSPAMKNITGYLLAMLIVGSLVFIVLYFAFGFSRSDAVFYAALAAITELISKGILRLYRLIVKKGNIQKSL